MAADHFKATLGAGKGVHADDEDVLALTVLGGDLVSGLGEEVVMSKDDVDGLLQAEGFGESGSY